MIKCAHSEAAGSSRAEEEELGSTTSHVHTAFKKVTRWVEGCLSFQKEFFVMQAMNPLCFSLMVASRLSFKPLPVLASLGTAVHSWTLETGLPFAPGKKHDVTVFPVRPSAAHAQHAGCGAAPIFPEVPLPDCFLWDEGSSTVSGRRQGGGAGSNSCQHPPKLAYPTCWQVTQPHPRGLTTENSDMAFQGEHSYHHNKSGHTKP